ncbi:hypothetical protein BCR33DRAFT_173775 [Rhizoclosmatium globosum]|uniref:Uncharacterized protein n=1 Tax=Rhizoclosmatium globosum TaxID=329046 RepID=A0A1Y2CHG4_9FUNG|nr:hypothetical protein BCR33DRAFT_173775 [Rhizoclosmatium globosum]|eukprot:ORY45755.1 hypothetical protein BCR33DRAFT_173775 [Rhizoclosmatium globosum]
MLYAIMNISMPWRIPFHIAWNDPIQYNFKNPWASTSLHDFVRAFYFTISNPNIQTLSNSGPAAGTSKFVTQFIGSIHSRSTYTLKPIPSKKHQNLQITSDTP